MLCSISTRHLTKLEGARGSQAVTPLSCAAGGMGSQRGCLHSALSTRRPPDGLWAVTGNRARANTKFSRNKSSQARGRLISQLGEEGTWGRWPPSSLAAVGLDLRPRPVLSAQDTECGPWALAHLSPWRGSHGRARRGPVRAEGRGLRAREGQRDQR